MPEGTTASIGPDGIRRETTFQYDYAPPPQPPQELDQAAVMEGLKSEKVEDALKRINAAQYFLGSRLLKQAQENNDTNGMMRAMLMMTPKNPQAAVNYQRLITPPVARPVNALEQARIDEIKRKAALPIPARSASPGSAIYDSSGKIITNVPSAASTRDKFDTVIEKYDKKDAVDPTPAVPGGWFRSAKPATPGQPFVPEREIRRQIPRGAGSSNAAPAQATSPAPPEKIRVISPDGKKGFIPASQKDSALEQGYKLVP